jgi:hypothetical protein
MFKMGFLFHDGAKVFDDTFFNSRPPRRCRYPRSFQAGGSRDSRWVLRTLPRGLPLELYAKLRTNLVMHSQAACPEGVYPEKQIANGSEIQSHLKSI